MNYFSGSPDSDDMSMEEIIRRARDDTEILAVKQLTPKASLRALFPKGGYKYVTVLHSYCTAKEAWTVIVINVLFMQILIFCPGNLRKGP